MEIKWKVALSDLDYDQNEIKAVTKVLGLKWLTMGETVEELEQALAKFLQVKHTIAVSSGTAALHLAMRAAGIGPGDEVLVPALSFVATANVVLHCGARPVFCDMVSLEEPNISPAEIRHKLTARTRAIIVMHYAGFACQMAEIKGLIKDKASAKIYLIEDAAHAMGGRATEGEFLGTIGDIGCFSFFSNKNLPVGEGGLVVTNNEKIAYKVRLMRSHCLTTTTTLRHKEGYKSYDVTELGYNYRPTEITAALGLAQLKKLPGHNKKRKELFSYYHKKLSGMAELRLPFPVDKDWGQPAFHIMPVLLPTKKQRDNLMLDLRQAGVQTSHHYRLITDFTYYRQLLGNTSKQLPVSRQYSQREITLPLHPLMSFKDIDYIVSKLPKG